jgi:hypothetical protein
MASVAQHAKNAVIASIELAVARIRDATTN